MNWIDRTYTGKEKLWKVFWFGYAAPFFPCLIAFKIFMEKAASLPTGAPLVVFLAIFIYQAWLAIALWQCAPNVKHRVFYYLARIFAALLGVMALGAALQVLRFLS